MKICVITRHAVINYGSFLQALATQTIIQKMGHECEIINYIRDDESYKRREMTLLNHKPAWNTNLVKKLLYLAIRQPESYIAGRNFEANRKKLLNLTKLYRSEEELIKEPPLADVYMTGSDQVWGPSENGVYDTVYFLSFIPREKKKIAYAASFGRTELKNGVKNIFESNLCDYSHIAVREESAVNIIKSIGLEAKQVLDPTLLLQKKEWEYFMKRIPDKKYILVYQLHNDSNLGSYAKKVAEAKNLPLVRISMSFHQIIRPGKLVLTSDIGDFLSYINNAECLITDSFHGTCFAINFNTNFVEVLPNNGTKTRNISLLRMLGLTDRILQDASDISLALKDIDFEKANRILNVERIKSIKLLQNMIEN